MSERKPLSLDLSQQWRCMCCGKILPYASNLHASNEHGYPSAQTMVEEGKLVPLKPPRLSKAQLEALKAIRKECRC
ncbi:hypothetical protein [Anaeromusa acidaminophila]|uniref:hypothetical protein n=1 Tax=Anaeromusa acidaminophila TaxID=81464 RepID=UPI0012EA91D1|nr:hypothetical protein [Anaeromusa acidaminophila]